MDKIPPGPVHPAKPTIRFGIICPGPTLRVWQARCIRTLLALDNVELRLIVINGPPGSQATGTIAEAFRNHADGLLFWLYRKLFVRPGAERPADMADTFGGIPALVCRTTGSDCLSRRFSPHDVERIRRFDLDFILQFGSDRVTGDILSAARYGVWTFRHGDEADGPEAAACFWDIYNGSKVTAATLERVVEGPDGRIVLKKGFFKTGAYSFGENIDSVILAAATWPAQVCKEIRFGNTEHLTSHPCPMPLTAGDYPGNVVMLRFLYVLTRNMLSKWYRQRFYRELWNVGVISQSIQTSLELGVTPAIRWLPELPKGEFVADPFGIVTGDELHILVEHYDPRPGKGIISHIQVTKDGHLSRPQSVMELPVHMSYPYLFQHEGAVYCIPETHKAREVSLYKAEKFPHRWKKVATLLENIAGADASVFEHDGRWWLLCVDADEVDACTNLLIWHAPDLCGPWQPHAMNPVKTDVRSSRPAGTPFTHNGVLYRPAQNCADVYGGSITVNQVVTLTPTAFEEQPVAAIRPAQDGPYPSGIHTLAAVGGVTLVDGKRTVFVTRVLPRILQGYIDRVARRTRADPNANAVIRGEA